MGQKKKKGRNFNWKLSVCSLVATVLVVMAMFIVPVIGKADAVHYLRPYQTYKGTIYDGVVGKSFTMAGTKFTYGITSNNDYGDAMYTVFYLGEQVSSVSFTLGHLDNQYQRGGTFQLYLDEVLQEDFTKSLTSDMLNETVTVNTAGKKQMKVKISGDCARYGIGNIMMSTGHNYKAEVTKVATVNDAGLVTYTCKDCGDTYQETISARTNCIDSISPYQTSRMSEYKEEMGSTSYVSCMGDKKYRCLKTTNDYSGAANALYSLNGNYTSVTFMVGHVDGDYIMAGTLNIYVDGNQIKQESLYKAMISKQITIDTTNVTQLKLEIDGDCARYVIYDFVATPKIPTVKQHSFVDETLIEATFGVPGSIRHVCSVCGAYYTTNTEPGTRNMTDSNISVSLKKNAYVYSGKACTPTVTVAYAGTTLKKGADYAVSYSNNKNVGTAKVKITGLGYYKGEISLTFTIQPKKTEISSLKNKKKEKAVVKWKKNSQADGYEVVYSTSSYFYNSKRKNVTKKTSATLSGLSKGYTYYVAVRAYKKSNGTKMYGDFGKVKTVYIKK